MMRQTGPYCLEGRRLAADGRATLMNASSSASRFFTIRRVSAIASTSDGGSRRIRSSIEASLGSFTALRTRRSAASKAASMDGTLEPARSMVTELMIDAITGDGPGGDLALAFLGGSYGAAGPSFGDLSDCLNGMMVGSGTQASFNALTSFFGG